MKRSTNSAPVSLSTSYLIGSALIGISMITLKSSGRLRPGVTRSRLIAVLAFWFAATVHRRHFRGDRGKVNCSDHRHGGDCDRVVRMKNNRTDSACGNEQPGRRLHIAVIGTR